VPGDVPLAEGVGPVPGRLEGLRERDAPVVEVPSVGVEALVLRHVPDAGLVRVEAGEQAGAGRAAAGRVVELGGPRPAGGAGGGGGGGEGGGADRAAVAAEVGEAQVVGENDDDVGSRRVGGASQGRQETQDRDECDGPSARRERGHSGTGGNGTGPPYHSRAG